MNTTIARPRRRQLSAVVLAVSLFAYTGCTQVPATRETAAPAAATQPIVLQSTPAQAPAAGDLQRVVNEAYAKFKGDTTGKNADYIPYLASVPSNLFAVVIVTADGKVFSA